MIRITILKDGVRQVVEFEENLARDFNRVIGQIDGLMRRAWPDQMRRKCLNLSRDTTTAQHQQPDATTEPQGTVTGRIGLNRSYFANMPRPAPLDEVYRPRMSDPIANWGDNIALNTSPTTGIGYSLDEAVAVSSEPRNTDF